ncbi:site-2 protease family protein [Frankia sp. AgB32]|uniref:site-2 protease family protein n=1 Tax=Frankia sp. AgB32 TaxID=631119 RepID=UPI00200D5FCB|nr:site-2 protease family protein [Frankia sp. AgB32]MCK9894296.1 site-2 protease family protein [Frankia sp. AgB32]
MSAGAVCTVFGAAFCVTLCFSLLFIVIAVVLHELSHAAAALAVGYRVEGFVFGGGPDRFRWTGRFRISLGARPAAATIVSPRRGLIWGWRAVIVYLAGPLANLVVGFVAAGLVAVMLAENHAKQNRLVESGVAELPPLEWFSSVVLHSASYEEGVIADFVLINCVIAVSSLVFRPARPGRLATDGWLIRNYLRKRRIVTWLNVGSEVVIERPVNVVWDFLAEPANLALYTGGLLTAERKAGTPTGVGEVWVIKSRPAGDSFAPPIEEIIREHRPPWTVVMGPVESPTVRGVTRLRRTRRNGTLLRQEMQLAIPAKNGLAARYAELVRLERAELDQRQLAIRQILTAQADGTPAESVQVMKVGTVVLAGVDGLPADPDSSSGKRGQGVEDGAETFGVALGAADLVESGLVEG